MIRLPAAALLVLLGLGGCTFLEPEPGPDVPALVAEHRYVAALSALEQQRASNPNYLQQRQELLEAATLHQSQLLQSLRKAMDQQDFAGAQQALDAASPELPPNAELTAFSAEFGRARNRYLREKLGDLYQLRGENLLREQPAYQALEALGGDAELQAAIDRYRADAAYFARLLTDAGVEAAQGEDYATALRYLNTAQRLQPAPEPALAGAIDEVKRGDARRRERERQARSNEREQRYRKQENAVQAALASSDYLEAREQLATLREIGLHAAEVEQYRRRLDEAIAGYVAAQTDLGNRHYAEGRIEAALADWRAAAVLELTPELKERIERAEKFIQRYQDLRQQPAARPGAARPLSGN